MFSPARLREQQDTSSNFIPQDHYLYFKSRGALGYVYFYQGDKSETYNAGKSILEYGQQHSNIRSQVMGYWIMAFSYILDGNHAAISECLEKALQISTDPFYSQFVKLSLGNVYAASGDFSKAEPVLNDVAAFSRKYGCEMFLEVIQPDLDKIRQSKRNAS